MQDTMTELAIKIEKSNLAIGYTHPWCRAEIDAARRLADALEWRLVRVDRPRSA